jgi:SNF2 family DNA or RNA helicase
LVQEGVVTAANAGGIMSKLMQIACGWVYTTTGRVATLDNDARLHAALDLIESTSNKILIFATFKHATSGIALALKAAGYNKDNESDFAIVTGDTPAGERNEIFTLFQKTDKYRIMVAHPQCLAHGVTLTRADTILWFNPTTNLETYEQANRRIRRVGQKHKQQVVHFQGAPIEKHVYQLLGTKKVAQVSLLDLFKAQTAA